MAGTLDTTFGTNGYTLSDFGGNPDSQANAQVIDSNNCTIVTGYTISATGYQLYLAKYTSNGVLDTTFGGGKGYVLGDYYIGKGSYGISVVLDSTGNILVTGYTYDSNGVGRLLLAKYKSNGELDTSFGGGKGWTADVIDNSQYSKGNSIILDNTGKIVITGGVQKIVDSVYYAFLARYSVDGNIDRTFGNSGTGYTIINSTGGTVSGASVVIDSTTGEIIVFAASEYNNNAFNYCYLIWFTNNGLLDTNFGNGLGYLDIIDIIDGAQMVLDKNGRLLVSGAGSLDNINGGVKLARFNNDGTLDTTFGENSGTTITTIPNYNSGGISLVIDSNDRIIVTGAVGNSDKTIVKTLLLRYTSSGKLDTTFGGSGLGYSITSFGVLNQGIEFSIGYAVSLDNNGLIVVSGVAIVSTGQDSLIARFYNGAIITTTSTTSTTTIPYSTTSTTTHYQPICLVAGTPILTDQGIIAIEKIDPKKHTINHKRIVAITKSITPEDHLVVIEANSFGPNVPTQRTIMTPGHHIMVKGSLVPAKNLLGRIRGVGAVPYNGKDVLYNVLMEKHDVMIANNMVIETLHPTNKVARRIISELNKQ